MDQSLELTCDGPVFYPGGGGGGGGNGNDHSQICVVKNESQPPSPRADSTFTRYKDAYFKAWLNTRNILQHCWNML